MPFPLCFAEGATPSLRGGPGLVTLSWIVRGHRLGVQAEPVIFDSSIFMRLLPLMRYPLVLQCASPFRKGGVDLSYPATSAVIELAISLKPSQVRLSACTLWRTRHCH